MEAQGGPMFQIPRRRRQIIDAGIHCAGGTEDFPGNNHVSPMHIFMINPLHVNRQTLPGQPALCLLTVALNAAYAGSQSRGQDFHFIAGGDLSGQEGAGDDGAETGNGEYPVHGEPK